MNLLEKPMENGYKLNYPESCCIIHLLVMPIRLNHYMFNVRGIIQACTIDLYSHKTFLEILLRKVSMKLAETLGQKYRC